MKKNHLMLRFAGLTILASLFFFSCEQEDRFVGSDVVDGSAVNLNRVLLDLTAYTVMPDTLRSDEYSLNPNISLGVYNDPTFGKTKTSFYSQLRLSLLNPEFGDNAEVDSVVLELPVVSFNTEDTVSVEKNLIKTLYKLNVNAENTECSIEDTTYRFQTIRRFKVDSLYGNTEQTMTLQVNRVVESMKIIDSASYSNKDFAIGELFGTGEITKQANALEVSDYTTEDGSDDGTEISKDANPTYRIRLDNAVDFFQNEIIGNANSANLADQASFVANVLNGIKISVVEENGFFVNLNPTQFKFNIYYSYDNPDFTDEDGDGFNDGEEECGVMETFPRLSGTYALDMSNNYNVRHESIEHQTTGAITYDTPNAQTLYSAGLGGEKTIFEFNEDQIQELREKVNSEKWAIMEAHLKVYPDKDAQGDLPLPEYLYIYNYSENSLLADYGDVSAGQFAFPYTQISLAYDDEGEYYLLRITEQIKNIVEKNESLDKFAIEVGNYIVLDPSAYFYTPLNAFYSNRVYNPYRLAMVGTHPSTENENKKLQLEVLYSN